MDEGRRGEDASAEGRGEGTGYSHVGIVWGTPRVNADAVGIGVETTIRANVNVTCKLLSARYLCLSLAKDSRGEKNLPERGNKY